MSEESVKIIGFEAEKVKRIKAVQFKPTANGLTIIGGNNAQGKTSVLDAIAWVLGGAKFEPTSAGYNGEQPNVIAKLSNGLTVERFGKNSSLRVIDENGNRSGQELLNSFIEELALDLPKFMRSTSKEKAKIVLGILGIEDRLDAIRKKINAAYDERTVVGRLADCKKAYADELPYHDDVPDEEISTDALTDRYKNALEFNDNLENEKSELRKSISKMQSSKEELEEKQSSIPEKIKIAKQQILKWESELEFTNAEIDSVNEQISNKKALLKDKEENFKLLDISEFKSELNKTAEINVKVRENVAKKKALLEAREGQDAYNKLTEQVEQFRGEEMALLDNAKFPLKGLSIVGSELAYNGQAWDCMSGAEQLIVACSIVRALKPNCGFVLMDKLEALDLTTLKEFNDWLIEQNLQVIATRVSKGNECSIIIEDGKVAE